MTTRTMSPGTGLAWLKRGINLGRNNPKAIFGGVAILAVAALLPGVAQMALQAAFQPGQGGMLTIMALTTLVSVVLMPLLVGGYLRVIHASEQGRSARALDVLAPFRSGQGAGRLIGFGVLVVLLYLAFAFLVIALVGEGFLDWYMQVLTLSQQGGTPAPDSMPALPHGFGSVMGLGLLLGIFLGGVYSIGFGQVALTERSVGGALADGLAGTLKNLLPLLLLAVVAIVVLIVVALVVGLVVTLLAVVGGLVHPVLGTMLALPVYLALLLAIYVVMFGVMYHLWRDVAGGEPPPMVAGNGNDGGHHIEL